jgi:hypothetical protein
MSVATAMVERLRFKAFTTNAQITGQTKCGTYSCWVLTLTTSYMLRRTVIAESHNEATYEDAENRMEVHVIL